VCRACQPLPCVLCRLLAAELSGITSAADCCPLLLAAGRRSVLWGRSVFNSIRKFLQFQLTVNFVALVVAFVGAVAGGRIPLNVLQVGPLGCSSWLGRTRGTQSCVRSSPSTVLGQCSIHKRLLFPCTSYSLCLCLAPWCCQGSHNIVWHSAAAPPPLCPCPTLCTQTQFPTYLHTC
jgi:hypothetical protein